MNSPELLARLATDERGQPSAVPGKRVTHYRVEFEVRNPPPDTYAATFELDESYPDRIRTLPPNPDGQFRLRTTTYGDYPVVVRLRTRKGEQVVFTESVANALRRGMDETAGAPVRLAIEAIAAN